MSIFLLIVDEFDKIIDKMEKLEVHEKGILHRAFSVFIFNSKNEMLLQQRAKTKYHFPKLWSNACCSHPILDLEEIQNEAEKRLFFEMNINSKLSFFKKIKYFAKCQKTNLIENEIDYIFFGIYDNLEIHFNEKEVMNYKWISKNELQSQICNNSEIFTPWFKVIFEESDIFSCINP